MSHSKKKAREQIKKPKRHLRAVDATTLDVGPLIDDELEATSSEELSRAGDNFDATDPNFQSELEYEGYRSIEDSDNTAYGSRDNERSEGPREIVIEEREDRYGLSDLGEESAVDPQDNRR